jgi:hypothetical protein
MQDFLIRRSPATDWLISDRGAIDRALAECCVFGLPAVVTALDSTLQSRGRFANISEECVTMLLFLDSTLPPVRQFLPCSVGFTYHAAARFFISLSQQTTPDSPSEGVHLVLAIPHAIATVEQRGSFRVPLFRDSKLQVKLTPDDSMPGWTPQPVDISVMGIQVQFSDKSDPGLLIESDVLVELRLDTECVWLRAFVRNQRDHCYGLSFRDIIRVGELAPPDSLVRIVRALELDWLRRRPH